ncbi:PspA/IM30 family protein [Nostoc sp.]
MGLYDQNQSSQDALRKLREGASYSRAAQEIAERDYAKAQAEADKWEQEYQLALKGSNQDLISQAKFQKERYQAIASRLKKLVGEQQPQVDAIKSSLKSWEQKVSEAEKEVLCSKPQINDTISDFESLKNKFLEIEPYAQEVSHVFINSEDVDEELQRLKKEMLLPRKHQNIAIDKKDSKVILLEAIGETKEAIESAILNQECIQEIYEKAQEEAKYWKDKAYIALKNHDDNLALEAILSKIVHSKIVLILQTQLQQHEATVILLGKNLIALENFKKTLGNDTKL